jgi:cell pole-organizing protein PopZ
MSDPTAQEPTMEEILASIRRIISEDDAPAEAPAAAAPAPQPEPVKEPAPVIHAVPSAPEPHEDDEEVLELNEPAPHVEPKETHGDLDVFSPPSPEPAPAAPPPAPVIQSPRVDAPKPAAAPSPVFAAYPEEDDSLVSSHAASAAASHFGALSQSIGMPHSDQTLDGVVRELLKPLLKEWLDAHLTAIVEQTVQAEVERISRRRVY